MSGWPSTKSQKQHCKTNTLPNFPQTHGVTPPSKPLKRSLPAGLWLCNALIACGDPHTSLQWSAERMLRNEFQPWPPLPADPGGGFTGCAGSADSEAKLMQSRGLHTCAPASTPATAFSGCQPGRVSWGTFFFNVFLLFLFLFSFLKKRL